jgi:uncharacterized protein YukE
MAELKDAEPITFDFGAAERLAAQFRATANLLLTQVSHRTQLADAARKDWRGAYEVRFGENMQICGQDAELLAFAMRDAAAQVDELARLAKAESDRRAAAREWKVRHDKWKHKHDHESGLHKAWDASFGDSHEPKPPNLKPVDPPSSVITVPTPGPRR